MTGMEIFESGLEKDWLWYGLSEVGWLGRGSCLDSGEERCPRGGWVNNRLYVKGFLRLTHEFFELFHRTHLLVIAVLSLLLMLSL